MSALNVIIQPALNIFDSCRISVFRLYCILVCF